MMLLGHMRFDSRRSTTRAAALAFGLWCALVVGLLAAPLRWGSSALQVGDIAPRDLVAQRSVQYVSVVLTEEARLAAAAAVEPVYLPMDPEVQKAQRSSLAALLDQVALVRQRADLPSQSEKLTALERLPETADLGGEVKAALLAMTPAQFESLRASVLAALDSIMSQPIPPAHSTEAVETFLANPQNLPASPVEQSVQRALLTKFVIPNVAVDEVATRQRQENARQNVPPQVVTFARGQVVVPEGSAITAADLEALLKTGIIEDGLDLSKLIAGTVVGMSFGVLAGGYLFVFGYVPSPAWRRLAVVALSVAAVLAMVRFGAPPLLPDDDHRFLIYLMPVAAAGLIATSFVGLEFGALVSVLVGLTSAYFVVSEPAVPAATLRSSTDALQLGAAYTAGGLAGSLGVYRAERLARFSFAALLVALGVGGVLVVFWLLYDTSSPSWLPWVGLAAVAAGGGSALLALAAYVFLAQALHVTTRLQLLELAQTDHPLLRRLREEAPGTFHHSMMVAALAERAAERIGADPLLARAGSFYHDIGKLAHPEYFVENMLSGQPSPHDSLSPEESARIIRSHVTEGLELARRYNLPPVVRDFIPQHHGDRLVTFFYRQAARAGNQVDRSAFRYPGPKPQSREAAIVMLADSSEAVVRAVAERETAAIDELVDSIVAERLAEGQFDECDITLRELQLVAQSFKESLRAMYHRRIEYPEPVPEEVAAILAAPRFEETQLESTAAPPIDFTQ